MDKKKLLIVDNCFAHEKCSSGSNTPRYIEWQRDFDKEKEQDLIFFTDQNLFNLHHYRCKTSVALLVEPVSTFPYSYSFVKENYMKEGFFDYILTFDKELCELSDKFIYYPFGGSWVPEEDFKIYDKTKDVSIIASTKSQTSGHRLRGACIEYKGDQMDVFGRGRENELEHKIDGLKDYKYSVIIENIKMNDYFTEKIIDCISVGCVPIYWGTENIGNYFDKGSIIKFDTISELGYILDNICSIEDYNSRMDSIKKNLEISKQYRVAEDWIYENVLKPKNLV